MDVGVEDILGICIGEEKRVPVKSFVRSVEVVIRRKSLLAGGDPDGVTGQKASKRGAKPCFEYIVWRRTDALCIGGVLSFNENEVTPGTLRI